MLHKTIESIIIRTSVTPNKREAGEDGQVMDYKELCILPETGVVKVAIQYTEKTTKHFFLSGFFMSVFLF